MLYLGLGWWPANILPEKCYSNRDCHLPFKEKNKQIREQSSFLIHRGSSQALEVNKAMPIRENMLQLDLFFQDGRHAKWINPSDYVCHSLSCSTLPLTDLVGWWYVPLNKVAAFYETTDCTYRHGYYTFNTGSARNHETGMHYLDGGPKRIRSVMLGRNEATLLQEAMKATAVSRHCHLEDRFEGATLDVNGTLTNNTYEIERVGDEDLAGGLSSNWSDVLPDTTANSRGLHAGGEDAPQ